MTRSDGIASRKRAPSVRVGTWAGLCGQCEHRRQIVTDRGSEFLMCAAAGAETGLPRYPPLPVLNCPSFRPGTAADTPQENADPGTADDEGR